MLSLSIQDKPGMVTLSLTGPLHPCLAKHFEDEEESEDNSDNEEKELQGNQKKDTSCDSVGLGTPAFHIFLVRENLKTKQGLRPHSKHSNSALGCTVRIVHHRCPSWKTEIETKLCR
jgi:hypothetical protein